MINEEHIEKVRKYIQFCHPRIATILGEILEESRRMEAQIIASAAIIETLMQEAKEREKDPET